MEKSKVNQAKGQFQPWDPSLLFLRPGACWDLLVNAPSCPNSFHSLAEDLNANNKKRSFSFKKKKKKPGICLYSHCGPSMVVNPWKPNIQGRWAGKPTLPWRLSPIASGTLLQLWEAQDQFWWLNTSISHFPWVIPNGCSALGDTSLQDAVVPSHTEPQILSYQKEKGTFYTTIKSPKGSSGSFTAWCVCARICSKGNKIHKSFLEDVKGNESFAVLQVWLSTALGLT